MGSAGKPGIKKIRPVIDSHGDDRNKLQIIGITQSVIHLVLFPASQSPAPHDSPYKNITYTISFNMSIIIQTRSAINCIYSRY